MDRNNLFRKKSIRIIFALYIYCKKRSPQQKQQQIMLRALRTDKNCTNYYNACVWNRECLLHWRKQNEKKVFLVEVTFAMLRSKLVSWANTNRNLSPRPGVATTLCSYYLGEKRSEHAANSLPRTYVFFYLLFYPVLSPCQCLRRNNSTPLNISPFRSLKICPSTNLIKFRNVTED